MSADELKEKEDVLIAGEAEDEDLDQPEDDQEEKPDLGLDVKIDSPSACERHITVTIPREDIERYYDDAFTELMPTANVPGFRPGRAPRKLVEQRFRKEMTEQIKGSLLMDSMAQISENEKLTAISEPDFDFDVIEVPEEGPMTFEFDLEVRPEFDLPDWKGLEIERPVKKFTEEDVDRRLKKILSRFGQLVPHEGRAAPGDYVTLNVATTHDGRRLETAEEQVVRIAPVLSFHDGNLTGFDKLMEGVAAEDKREGQVKLTPDASNEELRGESVKVEFKVLEVKKLKLPELTEKFLAEMGGFESVADLRDAVRQELERQLEYRQGQATRRQITGALVESADWELPPGLLRRQSERELERAVLELRRNGFSEAEIRAHENELRQNSAASTARALKEHFILERIAEEEDLDADPDDFDAEIALIAMQSGESVRRIRAQLEKRGLMDSLRNQIIERKAIQLVESNAKFKDIPLKQDETDTEGIDMAAGGQKSALDIPDLTASPKA